MLPNDNTVAKPRIHSSQTSHNSAVRAVILLPLRPASLMHKKHQRRKVIHEMHPVGHKERSIDLKIFW